MAEARAPLIAPGRALAFALVASLFFAWALANSLNDVLIRHFRLALGLSRAEAGLIPSAFYAGYFVAALPAGWFMRRHGYKAGILLGLGLYAAGALLFWPAAEARAFPMFLAALGVIALGLACLETAANPYVTVLGAPETAAARLNLAQAFNGVGAIAGPLVGGLFILSSAAAPVGGAPVADATAVQLPYLVLALLVGLLALGVWRTPLPEIAGEGEGSVRAAWAHPRLRAAVAAQFAYVAAQVCIWSFFIDFAHEQLPGTPDDRLAFLLSSSIALVMLGRFAGAALMRHVPPARLLAACALANVALCAAAMLASGAVAVAAVWATSLFMAIMFPTIFALGVAGLGSATKVGGSLLIMAIVGGAVVPPAMGALADAAGGFHAAFAMPLACFAVVLWFARRRDVA